jgi:hypothetical protein
MMASFSDLGRNVMDRDDPVEDHNDNKDKQSEGEVIQEWIAKHGHTPSRTNNRSSAKCRIEIGQINCPYMSAIGPKQT